MSQANPLWGAPRVHGELQKLGITLSPSTVAKYLVRRPGHPHRRRGGRSSRITPARSWPPTSSWSPPATDRLLFVLVILAHERRRVVQIAVTDQPTAAWTAQQFRNAFPNEDCPSYLLHDRDSAFTGIAHTIAAMHIQAVVTAPRSPWQNAYVERFIGSIRRECLDHVIVLSAAGLQRVVKDYVAYYMRSRTHLSLDQDSPTPRTFMPPAAGRIVAVAEVSGLHHRYDRAPHSPGERRTGPAALRRSTTSARAVRDFDESRMWRRASR